VNDQHPKIGTEPEKPEHLIKWWPNHVIKGFILTVVLIGGLCYLATKYQVPDDAPAMMPFPDDGQNIPGPEWFFLVLWQPFWFFVGMKKKYLVLTAIVPLFFLLYLFFLPFIHDIPFRRIPWLGVPFRKIREMTPGRLKKTLYTAPIILIGCVLMVCLYRSGHQAKLFGCEACHTSANGPRMYIPPVDVVEYYQVDRARQIGVGKYRAGKASGVDKNGKLIVSVGGAAQGYKDANWQMRHMFEPTFTW